MIDTLLALQKIILLLSKDLDALARTAIKNELDILSEGADFGETPPVIVEAMGY